MNINNLLNFEGRIEYTIRLNIQEIASLFRWNFFDIFSPFLKSPIMRENQSP